MLLRQPLVTRIVGLLKETDMILTKIVYISQKGEVSWDVPLSKLATVEEHLPIKHHPHYAALQRAVDEGHGIHPM